MRVAGPVLAVILFGATLDAGLLEAEIFVDGRLVETKADGACIGFLTLSTSQRYIDCLNGTVWDTSTGLLWLKNARCAALGTAGDGTGTWTEALAAAAAVAHGLDCDGDGSPELTDGSQPGDWRLPTRWEWSETTFRARGLNCVAGEEGGPSLTNDTGDDCFSFGVGSSFVEVIQTSEYWSSTSPPSAPTLAVGWSLLTGFHAFIPRKILPPRPFIWPVRETLAHDGSAAVSVAGAPVETGLEGSCYGSLALGQERYVDCGDGTVLDTLTDLLWLQDATCSSLPSVEGDFLDATDAVAELGDGACGLTDGSQAGDWRLPTEDEWQAATQRAVDLGCTLAGAGDPPALTDAPGTGCLAAGTTPFAGLGDSTSLFFWTGKISDFVPTSLAGFSLNTATSTFVPKSNTAWVWPVRPRVPR